MVIFNSYVKLPEGILVFAAHSVARLGSHEAPRNIHQGEANEKEPRLVRGGIATGLAILVEALRSGCHRPYVGRTNMSPCIVPLDGYLLWYISHKFTIYHIIYIHIYIIYVIYHMSYVIYDIISYIYGCNLVFIPGYDLQTCSKFI